MQISQNLLCFIFWGSIQNTKNDTLDLKPYSLKMIINFEQTLTISKKRLLLIMIMQLFIMTRLFHL